MIKVSEAAVLLGGSEQWVRSLCKRNIIGEAWSGIIDYHRNIRAKRLTYHIIPGQLAEYMRISQEELVKRLEEVRNG